MKSSGSSHRFRLLGMKFGSLTVVADAGKDRWGHSRWTCVCACGRTIVRLGVQLKSGGHHSCGCNNPRGKTHGKSRSSAYQRWKGMMRRCYNPRCASYKDYGGRGITVCKRWHTFPSYYKDTGDSSPGMTIERINNDGNYCPKNTKWASRRDQVLNRRNSVCLTHKGKTMPLCDWAREIGVSPNVLWYRKRQGWSDERAIEEPLRSCHLRDARNREKRKNKKEKQ